MEINIVEITLHFITVMKNSAPENLHVLNQRDFFLGKFALNSWSVKFF